jgi:hypothetical protein
LVLGVIGLLLLAGWLVVRERLIPRRPARPEEVIAGHTVALLALGLTALVVMATNPFSLIFLLPSLYAWLWLPQAHAAHPIVRFALLAVGFTGPLLLTLSFSTRLGLGLETPWYLLSLVAVGYVPWIAVVLGLVWLAIGAQLTALTAGRYAPYSSSSRPSAARSIQRSVVSTENRRRGPRRGGPGLAQRQVARRLSGRELTLAGTNEHKRIRSGGAGDHVRLLAGHRDEQVLVALANRPCPHELVPVSRFASPTRRGARPRSSGPGLGLPAVPVAPDGRRARRRERGDRIPRQAEDEGRSARGKRERLAGLHGNSPEVLLRSELAEDPTHEVVRPTDTPPELTRTSASWPHSSARRCSSSSSTTGPIRSTTAPADSNAAASRGRSTRRSDLVPAPHPAPQLGPGAENDHPGPPAHETSATPAAASAPT